MAWQLIYTSAPRLLEAGRSGFGTVARHRQITPLLAAALERASQFARLPGMDATRSVFSHRVFTISGSRFHVLSCIRDAGADYTGRTNHLAHHLVAEAREIARLRSDGPTPADILLAMPWLRAWNEAPRHFDPADEVALADLTPLTPAEERPWERLTGRPNGAWLLASGEASRAAYVVVPPGTDLRPLFAESMRLNRERAWETTFTTALQPGDETADLRWIGLEPNSPLLASALQSGRTVLDLTAPHRLPAVETANPSPSTAPDAPVESARGRAIASTSPASLDLRGPALEEIVPEFRPSRPLPWKWIAGLAGLAVLGLGFGALLPLYHTHQEEIEARRVILETVKSGGVFDTAKTGQDMAAALEQVPRENLPKAREFANYTAALGQSVTAPDFAALRDAPAMPKAQALAKAAGMNLPTEIGAVAGELDKAAQMDGWLERYRQVSEDYRGFAALRQRSTEVTSVGRGLAQERDFEKLRTALEAFAERKQAEAILALLQSRMQPREKESWFQSAAAELPPGLADAATRPVIAAIKGLLVDWSFVENHTAQQVEDRLAAEHDPWPEWLLAKAREKVGPKTAAPAAPELTPENRPSTPAAPTAAKTVFYFVDDKARLATLDVKEFDDRLNFELRRAKGNVMKLAYNKDGIVRENFQSRNDGFRIKGHVVQPEAAAPATPFTLVGRDPHSGEDIVSIYAGHPADGEPIFGTLNHGLRVKDGKLFIDGTDAGLSGVVPQPLWLDVPGRFDGASAWNRLSRVENWQVDIQPFVEMWKKMAVERENELKSAEAELQAFKAERAHAFSAKALVEAVRMEAATLGAYFSKDGEKHFTEAQKQHNAGAACNEVLRAIGIDWHDWKNTEFAKADEIFNAGGNLPGKEGPAAASAFRDCVKTLETIERQATTNEQQRWIALLEIVKKELTPLAKTEAELTDFRARQEAELQAKAAAAKEGLAAVKGQPMLESRTPGGLYRLLVETPGGNKLPLVEFKIP